MKKLISSICLLLILSTTVAQNMPSQADMDKMMKQMKDVMKDMDPEAKKMMDSMGIKMPDLNKPVLPKGMTMNNVQQKMDEMAADEAAYQKKSLAEMPRKIFTDAELAAFLQSSFTKIDAKTTAKTKANAQKIIASSKAKNVSVENSAVAALMAKGSGEALWILAKLATENPKDANLLSNYAAVITMCGGPHLGIPVLNYLNNKYPNNSTVLNNLGQAWYDLGKNDSAEKYLNLAIKIFPYHSTANYTESKICEEKKDTARAFALYRNSLKYNCDGIPPTSPPKTPKIKPEKRDVEWPFPDDPDPLGFERITIPEYPMDVQSSEILEPNWIAFKSFWKAQAAKYEKQSDDLVAKMQQAQMTQFSNALKTKDASAFELPFAEKAAIYYGQDIIEGGKLVAKSVGDQAEYNIEEKKLQKEKEEKEEALEQLMNKVYKGKCEGEGCPYKIYCPDFALRENDIKNTYLSKVNPKYDYLINERLKGLKMTLNAEVKMALYGSTTNIQFEQTKAHAKYVYAQALADISYTFIRETPKDCNIKDLADGNYDGSMGDLECGEKISVGVGLASVSLGCSTFSIEGGEFVQGSFEKNFRTGEYEIGIGVGIGGKIGGGPLCAEAGAKFMEMYHFNKEGKLTDAGVKASAGLQGTFGAAHAGAEGSVQIMMNKGITTGFEKSNGVGVLGVKY